MKKLLCFSILSILLVTGCGAEEEKTMTCTRTANQNSMKLELNYTITYQGKYVNKVESVEKITSDNEELLNTYKSSVEDIYSPYKDVEYYDYDVKIDDNTLTSTVNIDYKNIDTDKMIEIDSANKQLIKDGKVSLSDLQATYESLGASCE